MPYDEGIYADVVPSWGDRLWSFVNESAVMTSMLKAAGQGGSATEAMAVALTERFGNAANEKRVRELAKYLAWQALERQLFVCDGSSSRTERPGADTGTYAGGGLW